MWRLEQWSLVETVSKGEGPETKNEVSVFKKRQTQLSLTKSLREWIIKDAVKEEKEPDHIESLVHFIVIREGLPSSWEAE